MRALLAGCGTSTERHQRAPEHSLHQSAPCQVLDQHCCHHQRAGQAELEPGSGQLSNDPSDPVTREMETIAADIAVQRYNQTEEVNATKSRPKINTSGERDGVFLDEAG